MALTIACAGCAGSGGHSTATAPPTAATGTEAPHASKPQRVVTLTADRIDPQSLDMGTGDVLAFHNLSMKTFELQFISPKNVAQYTTCTLIKRVSPSEATAKGAVFQRQGDEVTATILPGTVVSVCSLKPGVYEYTANPLIEGAQFDNATLGMKGTIVVK
jgi:hypothetical protein